MGSEANQMKPMVDEEDEACLHALQYTHSWMVSMVLNTALELDIFGIIARAGPGAQISPSVIASQLPRQNPDIASKLDTMLRLFAAHSFLTCSLHTLEDGTVGRVYGLAPASKFLVGNEEEGCLASMIAMSSHRTTIETWSRMKDAILEGGDQFKKAHGMSIFQFMDKDPKFNNTFNQGMAGLTTIVMRKILDTYKGFEGLTSLVDVAGGTGRSLSMVVSKYPSIKGINYDLPHVIQTAPSYPGMEQVGGDMFLSIPKANAIMIKDTLHNWSDESCVKILKNCYEVLPEDGKVIIITMIIPEVPDTSMSSRHTAALNYVMMMQVHGKERSEKEYETLSKRSGFSGFSVACSAYDVWGVIELYK